uniref:hypothetical protein n=1 Tax=Rheinheimera sp. TaxID=1869214 RepID=UPI0040479A81
MNSTAQLEKDFGQYPPSLLLENTFLSGVKFNILYQGRFLRLYNAVRTMLAIFSIFKSPDKPQGKGENIDNITAMAHQFFLVQEHVKRSLRETLGVINSKKIVARVALKVLLIFLILLLLPVIALYLAFIFSKLLLLTSKKLGRNYGYYSILPRQVPVIFFNSDNFGKLKVSHDAAISHEHIHVLQHCIGSKVIDSVDIDKHLQFADCILKDGDKGDSYIHYLMQRDETEARLHEIVLSYYRVTETLPTSYQEFVELICCFETFYNLFDAHAGNVVACLDKDFLPIDELEVREQHFFIEFYCILRGMKNEEMLTRYTLEVLPMLYSNLLLLYGGEVVRGEFIKTIPCSDMYHALYPKLIVSSDEASLAEL